MEKYVDKFYENSIKKWDSIIHGRGFKCNIYHDKNIKIRKKLSELNCLNELEVLLDSDNDSVLLEAASALLDINSSRAIDVLNNLSEKKGSIAFTAEMNLKHYYSKIDSDRK